MFLGLHVDPGFSGPLKFAVFNAGPSTICVKQGEESFLIWYADLDSEDTENIKTTEGSISNHAPTKWRAPRTLLCAMGHNSTSRQKKW